VNNWTGGIVADVAQSTANLSTIDQAADITVTMDSSRTLGILTVGDTNNTNSYLLSGTGGATLTLDNYGLATQLNQIATSKGDTLGSTLPIRLASNLEIRNSSANGLAVNGGISAIYGGAKIISNLGTGTGAVTLGGNITDGTGRVYITQNSANSVLALTGTNTYTGWTTITNGALRANNGAGLPANSCLMLNGGVLESSGTFARNINNTYRNVYWVGNGGFAAYGGALTVTLNGGGTIDWGNNPQGFNGKTLIFGSTTATNNVTVTNRINLKGDRTVQVNDNTGSLSDVAEFSGIIANGDATARAFTKTGTGTLVLSGANTYSGTTTVSAGPLRITGSNSSAGGTTVSGTGTLQMAGGTLASGALALNGGAIEAYGAARTVGNTVTWGGNFGLRGSQNLTFTGTTTASGRVVAVDNAGTTTLGQVICSGSNTFNFSNGSGNVVLDANTTLTGGNFTFTVNKTGTAGVLLVNGAVKEDVAGRALTMAGTGTMVLSGANTYSGLTTVNGTLSPQRGTLVLSGSNNSAGATTLTAGVLQLGSASNGGLASGILTFGNGTLDYAVIQPVNAGRTISNATVLNNTYGTISGSQDLQITGTFTNSGGNRTLVNSLDSGKTLTLAGTVNLSNDATARTLTIQGTGGTTISGAIVNGGAGAGVLTVTSTGTTVLSGSNTYTGATNVNLGGNLKLDYSTDANSKLSDTAALTLGDAAVQLAGGTHPEVVSATTLNAGLSSVTQTSGTSVLRMNAITANTGAIINFGAAGIADTDKTNTSGILGSWATIGGADWAINSTNAGDGPITANTAYTDIPALGSTITNGSTTNVRINSEGAGGNIALSDATTAVNTLLQNTATAATVDTAAKAFQTTGIMIGAGQEALTIGVAAGDGTLSGTASNGSVILINNNAAKTLTVNAKIINNGTTPVTTAGNVLLNAVNTYTGATSVGSGTLEIGGAGQLNTGAYAGTVAIGAGATLKYSSSAAQTLSGVISGAGGVTQNGAGTLTLSGGNSYYGPTTVNSGILTAGNAAAFGSAAFASLAFGPASTGKVQLNGFSVTVTGLNTNATVGTPIVESGSATAGTDTLTVNSWTDSTFAGVIQNGGVRLVGLTKAGWGQLTLSGANTYTGPTAVNAGSLKVTGSIGSSTNTVTVSNQNTVLTGGGSVTASTLTMNANTILAPGNSVGTLAVAGNASLAAGTVYQWELGSGGNDVVNVTGNVTLTNGWVLELIDAGGTPAAGTQYNLFTYTGTGTLGTYVLKGGVDWDISGAIIANDVLGKRVYITGIAETGSGIIVPQSIPEPCTAMLLVFGAAVLLRRRRGAGAV
jgi:autotransporter-associated beta strand protein